MKKIEGVLTALITPFQNGEVDYSSLKTLVRNQLDNGVEGLIVHGTTAESPTTTAKEKEKIFLTIKSEVAGQVPLVVGSGSNSTEDSVEKTREAKKWGADAALTVVPYYNKPPQRGLVSHFNKIAKESDFPIILYNVPGRTIASLEIETIMELSKNPLIVGIKEASGDLSFGKKILEVTREKFILLSGDDKSCMNLISEGGHGVISVCSHLLLPQMKNCLKDMKKNKQEALQRFKTLYPLIDSLYLESNPIPVKYALQASGIISSDELRLPLVSLREDLKVKVKKEMSILL